MTAPAREWKCGSFSLSLKSPLVMGIVNVTPDSFSDGGKWSTKDSALGHALTLLEEGADILDIGGESTRPGSDPVPLEEELGRVIPVIESLRGCGVPISVDTNKPEVMREAVKAGASIINDVWALRRPGALEAAAASGCGICLMHMQNDPKTMQVAPSYQDFWREVHDFLIDRAEAAEKLGIEKSRICLDPGFGFGKTDAQNFELIARASEMVKWGYPILFGASRKSSLGRTAGIERAEERTAVSVAAHVLAAERGVQIVRVHDVKETVQAFKILEAVERIKDHS